MTTAEQHASDALVLGSLGHGSFAEPLHGSVAREVFQPAKCTVVMGR
jgi:nucleotide-binding universal stress UspA family protein